MSGIIAYGSYIPVWRLESDAVAKALGKRGKRRVRAVASFDEDSTTLAVEAARRLLDTAPAEFARGVDALVFATGAPVYADRTNATALHAALDLSTSVRVSDSAGSTRGGVASLLAALRSHETTLVAMSDTNTGPAGSSLETSWGDAGASFLVAESDDVVAELIGQASVTAEFGDRWRTPGEPWSKFWEERFAEGVYRDLGEQSATAAMKSAGINVSQIDHFAITGVSPRAASQLAKELGIEKANLVDDLATEVGFTGTAHPGVVLAAALDVAQPGQVIALVSLIDGADTLILRATQTLPRRRSTSAVHTQLGRGRRNLSYVDFLVWKGQLQVDLPRRPDPDRVAAPPAYRDVAWKFGFAGTECADCGTRHLPPQDVCLRCGTPTEMRPVRLANVPGTIATYAVDHLAYTPAPPVVAAVIDFDGGGRFSCELTDVKADDIAIGQRVSMTFRRLSTADGVANYFWKARPLGQEKEGE